MESKVGPYLGRSGRSYSTCLDRVQGPSIPDRYNYRETIIRFTRIYLVWIQKHARLLNPCTTSHHSVHSQGELQQRRHAAAVPADCLRLKSSGTSPLLLRPFSGVCPPSTMSSRVSLLLAATTTLIAFLPCVCGQVIATATCLSQYDWVNVLEPLTLLYAYIK
jgi:hypothetical protein